MNYLDIIIILFLLWGAYKGFEKGFVIQSLTLAALIFGVWAGLKFSGLAENFLISHFQIKSQLLPILSFVTIFILILVTVFFLSRFITSIIGETILGTLNRIGGIIFGILRMAFILSILIYIIEWADIHKHIIYPEDKSKSYLYSPVSKIAPFVFPYFRLEEIKNRMLKI